MSFGQKGSPLNCRSFVCLCSASPTEVGSRITPKGYPVSRLYCFAGHAGTYVVVLPHSNYGNRRSERNGYVWRVARWAPLSTPGGPLTLR
jgi:hypothetical protein